MTRTVPGVVETAAGQDTTQPIYLIRMGWDVASPDVNRRIATWAANISWNSETWEASGASVRSLDMNNGSLRLPNGSTDPWLNLVTTQIPRGRTIDIYEHHTSTGSPAGPDAVLLFSGLMDGWTIDRNGITIDLIASLVNKSFPPTSVGPPIYNYLLAAGTRIYWGPVDVILVD